MRLNRILLALAGCMLMAVPAFSQGNPTGTISGRVVSADGLSLPGVAVTVASPSLQGTRTAATSQNGDYIFPFLPPGEYTVTLELEGFSTIKHTLRVAAGQSEPLNVIMKISAVHETVTVTGRIDNFAQTAEVATSYKSSLIEVLPTNRTLTDTMLLAPGIKNSGPGGRITIAGSMSFENLFLVNGVVVNENMFGQALQLYIEDALEETTTKTGAISAEYGRFSGGVVSALTKSGSNSFSGSLRVSFANDSWRATTPFGEPKIDKTIPTYEFTVGGPVFKDRLWFFGAGRLYNQTASRQTSYTKIAYEYRSNEKRFEGKLTYSPISGHTFRGSLIKILADEKNAWSGMDLASLTDGKNPQQLLALNYTGVLTPKFFIEAQYSRRDFTLKGYGAGTTDLIDGTLMMDSTRGYSSYWSPAGCGVCPPEGRNNRNFLVKGSYFLSTSKLGSHNMVFGYDTFTDIRLVEQHVAASDWRIFAVGSVFRGTEIYPVLPGNGSTFFQWSPVLQRSSGTDFRTHAVYANDNWQLNKHLSFNLGLRYDKNRGRNGAGDLVAKDSMLSPRLALTYDPKGDGTWTASASYGRYAAAIANAIGDGGSGAGRSSHIRWAYLGPSMNVDPNGPLVPTAQAIQNIFDWFDANGGKSRSPVLVQILGLTAKVGEGLRSPNLREWTVSISRKLGTRGVVRVDAVVRKGYDFYSERADMSTGKVQGPPEFGSRLFDLELIENSNDFQRDYTALNTQVSYRVGSRLQLGGNWTISRTYGDWDGEDPGNARRTWLYVYPEYKEHRWFFPTGDLSNDERHRGRFWGTYDLPVSPRVGAVSVSVLEAFNTGHPYGAIGSVDTRPYVTNPGYLTPPSYVDFWFTPIDKFRTDTVTRTDLAVNYAYRFKGSGRPELFVQAHVFNLFNEAAIDDTLYRSMNAGVLNGNINTTILTPRNSGASYAAFNPFTQTPVQGANWDYGPQFGKPTSRFAYQMPRTFSFSMGFRF